MAAPLRTGPDTEPSQEAVHPAARSAALARTRLDTPLGPMDACAADGGLCLLEFADRRMLPAQWKRVEAHFGPVPQELGSHRHFKTLEQQLREYFAGERHDFDLPLMLAGTPFQESVWRRLLEIPYGETRSYDELAAAVGSVGGQRAVGRANGDNRIAVVVPCHRVIRADGALGGYGGGLVRKRRLLELESGAAQGRLW